jgi:hypothetical protein
VGHPEDNLPGARLPTSRTSSAEFDGDIVGANLSYDLDYLWHKGHLPEGQVRYRDVQVAEPLIDELQMSYSAGGNIAKRHNLPGKDEVLLKDAAPARGRREEGHVAAARPLRRTLR